MFGGVVIKKGCVIGSIVTKSTEEYGIYVGNPAKKIGKLYFETGGVGYKVDVVYTRANDKKLQLIN